MRFRQPDDQVIEKCSLSCQPMRMNSGELRLHAHVFAMPSVTEEKIDAFVEDLFAEGAFDRPATEPRPERPAGARSFATDVQPLTLVSVLGRGFQ